MALVIVQFTESLRGIRAVHAFRRQPRNDEIFGELSEGYRTSMSRSFQLLGVYWPGIVLVGNLTTAAVLLYGGTGSSTATWRSACWQPSSSISAASSSLSPK